MRLQPGRHRGRRAAARHHRRHQQAPSAACFQRGRHGSTPHTPTRWRGGRIRTSRRRGHDRRVRGHHHRRHHDRPRGAVGALRGRRRAGPPATTPRSPPDITRPTSPSWPSGSSSARTQAPGSWPSAFVLRLLHHPFIVEPVCEAERGMALRQERRHALSTTIALAFIFMGSLLLQRPGMGARRHVPAS